MARATDIASLEGLEGLSIGRLATDLAISKSGVFAHFGSKEELQLAAIDAAVAIYRQRVVLPAQSEPSGLVRLWLLADGWLAYSRERVFPGGCFFFNAQAEFDARPGRVRDALATASSRWHDLLGKAAEDARCAGDTVADLDADQLVFEVIAFLEAANGTNLLHEDGRAYDRAATAIRSRLLNASTAPASLAPRLTPRGDLRDPAA
nr:TetR/AcrR family transcriptional regulator [Streptomyces sp. SID3343]